MNNKYELVFVGSVGSPYLPKYKRNHPTLKSAIETAVQVLEDLEYGPAFGSHPAIVYGPGCGLDGRPLGSRPEEARRKLQEVAS